MAAWEYASGHPISVSPVPKELTFFSLAKEFGWLPDEIERQDPKSIKGVIHVLSAYNSARNNEIERSSRKKSLGMTGGPGKHYIDVTDPEVEKQLEQGKLRV